MTPRHRTVNEHKGSLCNTSTYALSHSAVKPKLSSDLKKLSLRWHRQNDSSSRKCQKENPQKQQSWKLWEMTAVSRQVHTLPLPDTVSYYSPPLATRHTGAPPITNSQRERERKERGVERGEWKGGAHLQHDPDSFFTWTADAQV